MTWTMRTQDEWVLVDGANQEHARAWRAENKWYWSTNGRIPRRGMADSVVHAIQAADRARAKK